MPVPAGKNSTQRKDDLVYEKSSSEFLETEAQERRVAYQTLYDQGMERLKEGDVSGAFDSLRRMDRMSHIAGEKPALLKNLETAIYDSDK